VHKATDTQIVGLCHGVKHGERELADLLGVEQERCRLTAVGMNHLAFFTEFTVDGEDAWPRVREKLESAPPARGEALRRELFLKCGAYSVLHDRHLAEFFPQFHRDGSHPDGKLGVDLFSFEDCIAGGDRGYEAMADQAAGRVPLDESVLERQVGEHEQLVTIFRSLESSEAGRYSVILPNVGQVTNLPHEFAVECPAMVSRDGIVPERLGRVPPFVRAVVEKALLTVELAVDAALEQDKGRFLQALIADGSVASMADAVGLADELWQANAQYL
jgi:alpha-galactosidase